MMSAAAARFTARESASVPAEAVSDPRLRLITSMP
jgi:hypothetical protein